ncbi:hypothetical protein CANARDRAFT_9575 [[Candida] arabinofermentans NRRL YB-2248]|uniref:Inheritance of peroxisomes protein 1 n=1 Tax=[Candida] arabinofermentans NRRL YB-2248 TaxID=983967 RepID=A0A1E4SVI2_9ASCO|nr:hypothetical protein CANARDRAFT_9575 [[Candida] arabinofermentans NRRL YB-2248]
MPSKSDLVPLMNHSMNDNSDQISLTNSLIQKFENEFNEKPTLTNFKKSYTNLNLSPRKRSIANFNSNSNSNKKSLDKSKNPFHSIFNKRSKDKSVTKENNNKHTDKNIIFTYPNARITSYNISKNKNDEIPLNGTLIGHGELQIYKLSTSTSTSSTYYLNCGSVLYPILSRLKIIKIDYNSFILHLFNPERYWKITLIGKLMDDFKFELILNDICDFKNRWFNDGNLVNDLNNDSNDMKSNDNDINNDLNNMKSNVNDIILDKSQDIIEEDNSISKDNTVTNISLIDKEIPLKIPQTKSYQSITSVTSTLACFNLDDDDELISNEDTPLNDLNEDTPTELNELPLNDLNNDASTELNKEEIPSNNNNRSLTPNNLLTDDFLKHPTPLKPPSSHSSLDSILDTFGIISSDEEEELEEELEDDDLELDLIDDKLDGILSENSSWMDTSDINISKGSISKRFSLSFKEFDNLNSYKSKSRSRSNSIDLINMNVNISRDSNRVKGSYILQNSKTYSGFKPRISTIDDNIIPEGEIVSVKRGTGTGTGTWGNKLFGW